MAVLTKPTKKTNMTDQQRLNQLNQAYQTKSKAYFAFLQARAGEELTAEDRKVATELHDPVWATYKKIKSLEYKINRSYENQIPISCIF